MKKRITPCILVIAAMLSVIAPVSGLERPSHGFSDIIPGAWYEKAVTELCASGIISGTDPESFSPDVPATRGEALQAVYAMAGRPECSGESFSDIPADSPCAAAAIWAKNAGIVLGRGETFDPSAPITRQELAAMLYRYEQHLGGGFKGMWMFFLNVPDREKIADWAYEPICFLYMHGVMQGREDGSLDPASPATRAEFAALIHRFQGFER